MLVTGQFQFSLPENGRELADLLLDVPLPPLKQYESEKQFLGKITAYKDRCIADVAGAEAGRIERIVETSKGNPGLQDWLFRVALEKPPACDRCLDDMCNIVEKGERPDGQESVQFLEKLLLDSIVGLLSRAQQELLRASTLFLLPVPEAVMARLAKAAALSCDSADLARLSALGLWDVHEDSYCRGGSAVAINPLVRPLAGALNEDEERALAGFVVNDLFNQWAGPHGGIRRSRLKDFQLARLALLARQDEVLLHTAQFAVRWLEERFEYRQAAEMGEAAIACIQKSGHAVPLGLRRATAENHKLVGEVGPALAQFESALREMERMEQQYRPGDAQNHANLLAAHGRLLLELGRPDDALPEFEQARSLLQGARDRGIRLGDIARLLAVRGEPNEALKLDEESLAIFEALGDMREEAITLSDIARLLVARGEVDQALKLHQRRLAIFAALGDKRARAIRLADSARLLAAKGEMDQALKLNQEDLAVYVSLGDRLGIADTLWSIARIKLREQRSQQTVDHLAASYAICHQLENRVASCHMGLDFGRLLCAIGQRKKGLDVLERARNGFIEVNRPGDARHVQSIINEIEAERHDLA